VGSWGGTAASAGVLCVSEAAWGGRRAWPPDFVEAQGVAVLRGSFAGFADSPTDISRSDFELSSRLPPLVRAVGTCALRGAAGDAPCLPRVRLAAR